MANGVQTTRVGAATISVIDVYGIPTKIEELVQAPVGERSAAEAALFARTVALPVNCIVIQLPGVSVLVDAGTYDAAFDSSDQANRQPPPDLLARLAGIGVRPAEVGHVVITHLHGDHFNATTTRGATGYQPTFPNAGYYVGRADWEQPGLREALGKPDSLESHTLGVLDRAGLLVPVDGDRALGHGVEIVASPGETPGHQSLRVRSEGETLYCIGDLYHHEVEVVHPTWMVAWANRDSIIGSRQRLVEAALTENARLVATHLAGVGRLRRTASGVEWAAIVE
jgi:glyoxylase-like metal-dependent hydrolase (beta-lactamase superfamily II)